MKPLALVVLVASAASFSGGQTTDNLDDYCIAISQKVDAMDGIAAKVRPILPDLPAADRPKVVEYLKNLHVLHTTIRHDACDAKDLKSAKAATNRDMNKSLALTEEMSAYAKHGLAEAYRKKAQRGEGAK